MESQPAGEVDLSRLLKDLEARYGAAVVPMSKTPGKRVEAILIDRKAGSWTRLLEQIASSVQAEGWEPGGWEEEEATRGARAVLPVNR